MEYTVLAAAGMRQWCATMLHLIRILSEELIPEEALLPHMERSGERRSGGSGGGGSGGGSGGGGSGLSSLRQNTPLHLREVIQLLKKKSLQGDGRRGECVCVLIK